MAKSKATCNVLGCDNTLSDEQKEKNAPVCSSCEAAKMHLCESCGKELPVETIREGATICDQCEMGLADFEEPNLQEPDTEPFDYGGLWTSAVKDLVKAIT